MLPSLSHTIFTCVSWVSIHVVYIRVYIHIVLRICSGSSVLFCFVLLYRYWGIVTVPGSIPYGSRPRVDGSSPSTLTTSLVYRSPPLPLRTDPGTTTLTTRDLYPGGSVVWAGPKFVRPHWWRSWVMIRFFEIQDPNCRETLYRPLPKATQKPSMRRCTCTRAPSFSYFHYGNIIELIAAGQFVTSLDSSGSVSCRQHEHDNPHAHDNDNHNKIVRERSR